jgi:glycerol-3-phosphate acyltransferase PlsX
MARIAVDAMGGDHAPTEVVWGAIAAAGAGQHLILVGDEARLRPVLADAGADLPVVAASEVIEMGDDAAKAIRDKRDASVAVAARLVAEGEADGFVSAGSTGAAMAAAAFILGRLPGVGRPAIASIFPSRVVLVDSGANVSCRPEDLARFAVMGSALARIHFDVATPRVGLVNIGEEPNKGRDLEKETYRLLERTPGIDFVGNVEGRDLDADRAEVFVTDGFTGNVILKAAEGASRLTFRLAAEAMADPALEEAVAALQPAIAGLRRRLDPERTGGGHLLGVDGVAVIAHGSSTRVAIASAIGLAAEGADGDLPRRISEGLARAGELDT